jgi:hypothetical protein
MQKTTAPSTAEAEYYSASTAAAEVLYLQYLLQELGFAQQKPTPIYEDKRASSGATTSSADENGPSTLTSRSTSRTKSSRMVQCAW